LLVVRADDSNTVVFQTDPAVARDLFHSPDASAAIFAKMISRPCILAGAWGKNCGASRC